MSMQSDDELSESEEEILVYVEFEGLVGSNVFNNQDLQLDMTGIDTEHPVMQINGRFYEGIYEDAIGTYMFFEKDDDPQVDDIVFDKVPTLKYFAKTRKVLKMHRVFAKPRTEILSEGENSDYIPNLDILSKAGVPPKYQEEALEFWTKLRNNELGELSTYLEKQKISDEMKCKDIAPDLESEKDKSDTASEVKEELGKT